MLFECTKFAKQSKEYLAMAPSFGKFEESPQAIRLGHVSGLACLKASIAKKNH